MFLGIFYSFLTALFFSVSGMFIKIIYNNYTIGENLLFFCILFSSFLCYTFILFSQNKHPLNELKIDKRNLLLATINGGIFCLVLTNIFILASLKYIDIGIQRAIAFSNPILIVIIQRLFFKRKVDLKETISIFLMIFGLILIVGKVNISFENTMIKGMFFAFMSAIVFSTYSIVSENKKSTISETVFWIYSYSTAAIIMLIIMIFTGEIKTINVLFDYKFALSLFGLSFLYSTLPYYFFNVSIKKIGAARANMVLALTPILSLCLGVLFLNNTVTIFQIFGFFLVIGALVLVSIQTKKFFKNKS